MRRLPPAELVLPLTIVLAAVILGVSEFMTTFEFTSAGEPRSSSTAADRHSYALLILAVVAVAFTVYAVLTGLRSAAIATAVFGLAALLLFLILDLPDAGRVGPLGDDPSVYFADARADPQTGFWLAAVGGVVLGLASVAFATLRSHQLRAPMELFGSAPRSEPAPEPVDRSAAARSDRAAARERLARARRGERFDLESEPDHPRVDRN